MYWPAQAIAVAGTSDNAPASVHPSTRAARAGSTIWATAAGSHLKMLAVRARSRSGWPAEAFAQSMTPLTSSCSSTRMLKGCKSRWSSWPPAGGPTTLFAGTRVRADGSTSGAATPARAACTRPQVVPRLLALSGLTPSRFPAASPGKRSERTAEPVSRWATSTTRGTGRTELAAAQAATSRSRPAAAMTLSTYRPVAHVCPAAPAISFRVSSVSPNALAASRTTGDGPSDSTLQCTDRGSD